MFANEIAPHLIKMSHITCAFLSVFCKQRIVNDQDYRPKISHRIQDGLHKMAMYVFFLKIIYPGLHFWVFFTIFYISPITIQGIQNPTSPTPYLPVATLVHKQASLMLNLANTSQCVDALDHSSLTLSK